MFESYAQIPCVRAAKLLCAVKKVARAGLWRRAFLHGELGRLPSAQTSLTNANGVQNLPRFYFKHHPHRPTQAPGDDLAPLLPLLKYPVPTGAT